MRLRFDKEAEDNLKKSNYFLVEDEIGFLLKQNKVIEIEIGMGKGDFISQKALNNPNKIFIGIEKYPTVQQYAIKKIKDLNLKNVYLCNFDAFNIDNYFNEKSINKIYLNFSDPWPKSRHFKRRLTYKDFLNKYYKILKKDGYIEFKSDQKNLYNFTVEQIKNSNSFSICETSLDLHRFHKNNYQTEYEKRFTSKGQKIYFIKFKPI